MVACKLDQAGRRFAAPPGGSRLAHPSAGRLDAAAGVRMLLLGRRASLGLRNPRHNFGPVFLEPGHGLGSVDDALEGFPGWVLERFRLQSLRCILNEVVQAFVSLSALEGICNRRAGPSSSGQIDNARSVSLA